VGVGIAQLTSLTSGNAPFLRGAWERHGHKRDSDASPSQPYRTPGVRPGISQAQRARRIRDRAQYRLCRWRGRRPGTPGRSRPVHLFHRRVSSSGKGLSAEERRAYGQLSSFFAKHVAYAQIMATRRVSVSPVHGELGTPRAALQAGEPVSQVAGM
jgi:hypothetical protein